MLSRSSRQPKQRATLMYHTAHTRLFILLTIKRNTNIGLWDAAGAAAMGKELSPRVIKK